MRLFVALDLNEAVRGSLAEFLAELERSEFGRSAGVRWAKAESLHLTLKFIGEQREEKLPAVVDALAAVRANPERCAPGSNPERCAPGSSGPLQVAFRSFGCFPDQRRARSVVLRVRPRVLWAGVEAPPDLGLLAGAIESALVPLGIERESRPFSPHLTLGRIKDSGGFALPASRLWELLEAHREREFGRISAGEFFLYLSRTSPRGPEYTRLHSFPLEEA